MQRLTITGTINGVNAAFTLSATPVGYLEIFRNGLLQNPDSDYSVAGVTVTFGGSSLPQTGDSLIALDAGVAATTGGSGTGSVAISGLIMPAYRIAGITKRAMIVPSVDMYAEAIPALNRLLSMMNCDGHQIYSTSISAALPLTAGQKVYTIGVGGQLNVPRPVYIRGANILFPTTPVVRRHVDILDDDQWRSVTVQDITGAPPYQLYYDGGLDANGFGQVYLRFQPPAGYSIELYTWQALQTSFSASTDLALLPPGYEQAIVYNLAKQLAAMNPEMEHMSPAAYQIAESSLSTLIALNSRAPRIACEPGLSGDDYGPGYGWLDGGIG